MGIIQRYRCADERRVNLRLGRLNAGNFLSRIAGPPRRRETSATPARTARVPRRRSCELLPGPEVSHSTQTHGGRALRVPPLPHVRATPHSPHPRSASLPTFTWHSALDEGKAKVTALRFKLAVTQALNTLFGEVGAALPVDLLGFDEPKQEAILRLPSKCAPACMHVHVHHTCTTPGNHGTRSRARLWSALMLITDFEKKPCRVQVLAVAGTLSQLSGSPEWPRAHAGHRRPPGLPASPPHLATA